MFTESFNTYPCVGDKITCEVDGFTVTAIIEDEDAGNTPWEDDGHERVSDWVSRPKRPEERVLCASHSTYRYYDFAEAVKIALRDNWDAEPYGTGTPGQRAERAAERDYKAIKAWCNDEWSYCGVCVSVACDGVELTKRYDAALWGIKLNYPGGNNAYLTEVANELLDDALASARKVLKRLCTKVK